MLRISEFKTCLALFCLFILDFAFACGPPAYSTDCCSSSCGTSSYGGSPSCSPPSSSYPSYPSYPSTWSSYGSSSSGSSNSGSGSSSSGSGSLTSYRDIPIPKEYQAAARAHGLIRRHRSLTPLKGRILDKLQGPPRFKRSPRLIGTNFQE